MAERAPTGAGTTTSGPIQMEPGKQYLGLVCVHCHRIFAIAGPLEVPPDKAFQLGSRGPLNVECPHCKHNATYPIQQVRRVHAPVKP